VNDTPRTSFIHSNLFIFVMGQIVAFLCTIILIALAWQRMTDKLDQGEVWRARTELETQKWRANTEQQLNRLNSETNNDSYMIATDRDKIAAFEEHLKYIEDQVRKLDVIQLKIEHLEEKSKAK